MLLSPASLSMPEPPDALSLLGPHHPSPSMAAWSSCPFLISPWTLACILDRSCADGSFLPRSRRDRPHLPQLLAQSAAPSSDPGSYGWPVPPAPCAYQRPPSRLYGVDSSSAKAQAATLRYAASNDTVRICVVIPPLAASVSFVYSEMQLMIRRIHILH